MTVACLPTEELAIAVAEATTGEVQQAVLEQTRRLGTEGMMALSRQQQERLGFLEEGR